MQAHRLAGFDIHRVQLSGLMQNLHSTKCMHSFSNAHKTNVMCSLKMRLQHTRVW